MDKGLVRWGSFFRYICRSSFNAPQWENNRVRLMFRDGCGRVLQHCRKENKSWWKQWDRRSRGKEIRRTLFIFFIYNCHSMACFPLQSSQQLSFYPTKVNDTQQVKPINLRQFSHDHVSFRLSIKFQSWSSNHQLFHRSASSAYPGTTQSNLNGSPSSIAATDVLSLSEGEYPS